MSDDLVNQITLNYLISKSQLQKLNNKIKQKEQDNMKSDKEIYKDQIGELFTKCLNDEFPDDLLQDVRNSFTYFIEKSVYYLKIKANNLDTIASASEAEEDAVVNLEDEDDVASLEDEDLEEEDLEDDVASLEDNTVASLEEDVVTPVKPERVFKKNNKVVHSEGVENIQQLPLDWFTKVRYGYKQNRNLPLKNVKK
jgi:hypothetical protein